MHTKCMREQLSRSFATACDRENGKAQYGNEFEVSSPLLSAGLPFAFPSHWTC